MTDELHPTIDGKPLDGEDKVRPEGIEVDANGDPVRQGTLMLERESYERVIEGLKMVSDACAHLIRHEPLQAEHWRKFMVRFDQARRIAVQHAGLGLVLKENETQEVRGEPLPWRQCRQRFLDGVTQAAGGCRQLATCHRGDLWFSTMAGTLEDMARKLNAMRRIAARKAVREAPALILPPGFERGRLN
jgi:hypothetical protein